MPLGAVLISDRLLAELTADDHSEVLFQMACSAHHVSCAAALKNIEIMEQEEIFAHVRDIAPHFQARLQELRRHDIVGDTRGMGLLGCVEGAAPSGNSEAKGWQ